MQPTFSMIYLPLKMAKMIHFMEVNIQHAEHATEYQSPTTVTRSISTAPTGTIRDQWTSLKTQQDLVPGMVNILEATSKNES